MSQAQPQRQSETEQQQQQQQQEQEQEQEPIKYGDVFNVTGELANQPIAPQDAAMMQSAETNVFGQTQKGGPAAVMQSAATKNERTGLVSHDATTQVAGDEGVTVTETKLPGKRIITESVAGQVLGQYVDPAPVMAATTAGGIDVEEAPITIGEALAATAHTAGEKPVEQSDAAAIQAAEVRATGSSVIIPGGLAATAQSAASANEGLAQDVDKIKLNDVLAGATAKLPADKAATRQDAAGVMEAELRNNPNLTTYPGGVAASVAAAARLNERSS